jgi:hypothetical protein
MTPPDTAGRRLIVPARFGFEGQGGQLLINAHSVWAEPTADRSGSTILPGSTSCSLGSPWNAPESLAFVILTTTANELVRPLHDRMPVLLSPKGAEKWLADADADLLAPAPASWLATREVSARVNAVANDGPELLGPPAHVRQLKLI